MDRNIEFSEGRIENGKLVTTSIRTLKQSTILACPHVIIVASHYREDGSCKCNDPQDKDMPEWGYKWSKKHKRWN